MGGVSRMEEKVGKWGGSSGGGKENEWEWEKGKQRVGKGMIMWIYISSTSQCKISVYILGQSSEYLEFVLLGMNAC